MHRGAPLQVWGHQPAKMFWMPLAIFLGLRNAASMSTRCSLDLFGSLCSLAVFNWYENDVCSHCGWYFDTSWIGVSMCVYARILLRFSTVIIAWSCCHIFILIDNHDNHVIEVVSPPLPPRPATATTTTTATTQQQQQQQRQQRQQRQQKQQKQQQQQQQQQRQRRQRRQRRQQQQQQQQHQHCSMLGTRQDWSCRRGLRNVRSLALHFWYQYTASCQILLQDLPCLESTYSLTLKLLLRAAQSANLARRVLQEMAHQRPCVIQPIVQLWPS